MSRNQSHPFDQARPTQSTDTRELSPLRVASSRAKIFHSNAEFDPVIQLATSIRQALVAIPVHAVVVALAVLT